MIHKQQKIYMKTIKTHHSQSKIPATMLKAQMNTAFVHRSYISKYNTKTGLACMGD